MSVINHHEICGLNPKGQMRTWGGGGGGMQTENAIGSSGYTMFIIPFYLTMFRGSNEHASTALDVQREGGGRN